MSDFNWLVSVGSRPETVASTYDVQFGDGYAQHVESGLNNIRETWQVNREGLTLAEKTGIDALLRDRAGARVFTWTPPFATEEITVRCPRWSLVPKPGQRFDFSATFIQEFV